MEVGEAVSFNYDVRLDFNTSFTGKDLLRTRAAFRQLPATTPSLVTPFPMPPVLKSLTKKAVAVQRQP